VPEILKSGSLIQKPRTKRYFFDQLREDIPGYKLYQRKLKRRRYVWPLKKDSIVSEKIGEMDCSLDQDLTTDVSEEFKGSMTEYDCQKTTSILEGLMPKSQILLKDVEPSAVTIFIDKKVQALCERNKNMTSVIPKNTVKPSKTESKKLKKKGSLTLGNKITKLKFDSQQSELYCEVQSQQENRQPKKELISRKEVAVRDPLLLLNFYEKHLKFANHPTFNIQSLSQPF